MGQYSNKGLYNAYKKNNKERDALDYYATPREEVLNVLRIINPLAANDKVILEPSCGGGSMVEGILDYLRNNSIENRLLICTDIKDRGFNITGENILYEAGEGQDFLSPDYKHVSADFIIMNPPFSTIVPFTTKALGIASKVLMLARTQFMESEDRFDFVFKENPPTAIYQYVDRIKCYKNGDLNIGGSSAQAYAWFYWDQAAEKKETILRWIRRFDK